MEQLGARIEKVTERRSFSITSITVFSPSLIFDPT